MAAFENEMEPSFERALKKVEGFAGFLRHLDSQIDLCDAEIKRIKAHQDRFEKARERLNNLPIRSMEANGGPGFSTKAMRSGRQNSAS